MKRMVVNLPKFRVSKPGFDVDTAAVENLLFHEDFLFTQPYFFGYVVSPIAGNTGKDMATGTVQVTVPDITGDPIVILYASGGPLINVFPAIRSIGSGNDQDGYNVDSWIIGYEVISSTRIDVTFTKPFRTRSSPAGAYMILMRKA